MRYRLPAVLFAVAAHPAAADTLKMCLALAGTTEVQCACASDTLTDDIGAADAALYDAIGVLYVANMADGQAMADAWEGAMSTVATAQSQSKSDLGTRMNAAGAAHRDAINGCA